MYMGHSFAILFVIFLAFAPPTDCRRRKGHMSNIDKLKFLHVSDVHYTPFYNKSVDESNWCQSSGATSTADYEAPYGRIGCDSPADLWLIALKGMKEKARDANFIMLAGIETDCFIYVDQAAFVISLNNFEFYTQR